MRDTTNLQPATKNDIKKLASKSELKKVERTLRTEILRVEEKIENVDAKLDKKFGAVISKLDGIAKNLDDLRTDNIVGTHQTRELRIEVDNHEKRIKKIESSTHTA